MLLTPRCVCIYCQEQKVQQTSQQAWDGVWVCQKEKWGDLCWSIMIVRVVSGWSCTHRELFSCQLGDFNHLMEEKEVELWVSGTAPF